MRGMRLGAAMWMGLLVMPAAGWADTHDLSSTPTDTSVQSFMVEQNVYPAIEKLGRGIGNILTGWLEFPLAIRHHYNPNSPTTASGTMATGVVWGLIGTVMRTVVGVYETATFFIPIPEHFAPVLPPLERLECAPTRVKAGCR